MASNGSSGSLLTSQQSVPMLAGGIAHNDRSLRSLEFLNFLTRVRQGSELDTSPSSQLMPGLQLSVNSRESDYSTPPAAQQASATSVNTASSSSAARSCSILPHHTTIRIDAKHYISMDMPMPSYYTSQWEGRIKKQLETSIASSMAIRDDMEAPLMLEAFMAGRTKEVLKPSIWITCCSSRMKKQVKSHLKTLQWLKDSGFQYFVRVDKTFGFRTDDSTRFDAQLLIEARLPPVPETLCGIPAKAVSRNDRSPGKSEVPFTIGGLICMDGDFACLTAGHPFVPLSRDENEVKSETESSESEESDDSNSSHDSETGTSRVEHEYIDWKSRTSQGSSEEADGSFETQEKRASFQALALNSILSCWSHIDPFYDLYSDQSTVKDKGTDWAVLLVEPFPSLLVPNQFQIPGNELPTFVDEIICTHELVKGPVWVVAGSGIRKGVLNPNPASILIKERFRNVRQIMLDKSLQHGDSGSWVISEGKLSGFIIAGRESPPCGYMLLVEEVFEDMTSSLSQYLKISLPSREVIQQDRRKLEEHATFEAHDQLHVSKPTEGSEGDQVSRSMRQEHDLSNKFEKEGEANKENESALSSREAWKQTEQLPEASSSAEWSPWTYDLETLRWSSMRTSSEGEEYDYTYIDPGAALKRPLALAQRNPLLPTRGQCLALTDGQCRRIQDILDPDGMRFQKDWELNHQPELIRLYMTGMSFPQIEFEIKPKLTWSYKTYSNRFRDWSFPLKPEEREQTIIQLYSLVSETTTQSATSLHCRPIPPPPQLLSLSRPFGRGSSTDATVSRRSTTDRDSISTVHTMSSSTTGLWSSRVSIVSAAIDIFSDGASIATTNSSVSRSSVPVNSEVSGLRRPLKPPTHDPQRGLWNDHLRVIPCGENHQSLNWQDSFNRCSICGFTRWHALMIHAGSMDVNAFYTARSTLRSSGITTNDYAGNDGLHFLMAAGVEFDYFNALSQRDDCVRTNQNVFGQNPLHVLNPQHLKGYLMNLLEWIKSRGVPQGVLLTQRDIFGLTPMHTLLQHPLPLGTQYPKIVKIFPLFEHQLRSSDTNGRSVVQMMNIASLYLRSESESDYQKIQEGISDIKRLLANSSGSSSNAPEYGFCDIARGAKGDSWFGFFECQICKQTNAHSNSYNDQMRCACAHGRDRNEPDQTGLTPAHAIITRERAIDRRHETQAETAKLFRILIPPDTALLEGLHILDPAGNTLVHNIAVRGFDEILNYVLELETPIRRVAMVNSCSTGADGIERSVLACVIEKIRKLDNRMRVNWYNHDTKMLCITEGGHFKRCRDILIAAGAVQNPSVTKRWRIVS